MGSPGALPRKSRHLMVLLASFMLSAHYTVARVLGEEGGAPH